MEALAEFIRRSKAFHKPKSRACGGRRGSGSLSILASRKIDDGFIDTPILQHRSRQPAVMTLGGSKAQCNNDTGVVEIHPW